MEAKAKLNHLRMSPKKARLVVNLIRGMKVETAIIQLGFINKAAKLPVLKLLNSAISNAENNFSLKRGNLYIKEIKVDEGGVLKRWQPKAHGRATPIRKPLCHITIVLAEIEPTKAKVKAKKEIAKAKITKVESKEEIKEKIKEKIKPVKPVGENKEIKAPEGHDKEIEKDIEDVRMEGKHRHNQNMDKRAKKKDKGFIKKMFNRKSG